MSLEEKVDRILALLEKQPPTREILSAREAAQFVGKPSIEAFYLWRKKHQVRACGHGRYTLRSLKAALEREGRKTYQHLPAH